MTERDELLDCPKPEIEAADKEGYDPTADGPRVRLFGTVGNAVLALFLLVALVALVRSCWAG